VRLATTVRRRRRHTEALRPCLSVCLSVTSRCSIETDGRNNLFFDMGIFSNSPTLCFNEIQVSTKGYFHL